MKNEKYSDNKLILNKNRKFYIYMFMSHTSLGCMWHENTLNRDMCCSIFLYIVLYTRWKINIFFLTWFIDKKSLIEKRLKWVINIFDIFPQENVRPQFKTSTNRVRRSPRTGVSRTIFSYQIAPIALYYI